MYNNIVIITVMRFMVCRYRYLLITKGFERASESDVVSDLTNKNDLQIGGIIVLGLTPQQKDRLQ